MATPPAAWEYQVTKSDHVVTVKPRKQSSNLSVFEMVI